MLEEDLLIGESHPLVNLCSLLDVGGEDGLVGTELGDYLLLACAQFGINTTRNDWGIGLIRYCDTTRGFLDTVSLRQG